MEMEEQVEKAWTVCGRSYKRTEEFWGRTSKTGIQKITCEPCASFLLVMAFSYTLHDGIPSAGSFSYSPMLLYMGSFSWFTHPVLVYVWSTSCAGLYGKFLLHAQCWFIWGVSLTHPMLASFSWEFLSSGLCWLLYVGNFFFTKQIFQVNKNVHNWVMLLLFKAEVDIQYRLHKVASCLPLQADSAEINTNMKWVPVISVKQ